ncbi:MAG: hypothetical protein H0U88_01220 [Chthoniobacterales bacterium]|nr:hypothetical protein [Chthoniobacterales bacterium]
MKKLLLAVAALALAFAAAERAEARVDVSLDFFYENLNDGGSWIEVGDYGYCWQPDVAVSNPRWRPYADGYWAYTDVGWTWVSYEDFGWATYHYGRWARLREQGWVWVPGREWGPAWVSWRTGGDYVGWAPLPPRYDRGGGAEVIYEGRSLSNTIDIDLDIGPAYYNFVDVRYIGEPVLRERIFESAQNITYINQTVNVTNITYNNSVVYNHGPDYNRLSAYSTRPIRRMTLERRANADYAMAAQAGGFTKVQGDRLIVAAPPIAQQPAQQAQLAPPKRVKTRIAKPDVETGWMGISDPKAKADLQKKFKKENPKAVPPPDFQPTNPALLTAAPEAPLGSSPVPGAVSAVPSPGASQPSSAALSQEDALKGKGRQKDKRDQSQQQPAQPTTAPVGGAVTIPDATDIPGAEAVPPSASGAPGDRRNDATGRGRQRNSRVPNEQQRAQPIPAPASEAAPTPDATVIPGALPNENSRQKGKDKRSSGSQQSQPPGVPPTGASGPEAGASPVAPAGDWRGRGKRGDRPAPEIEAAAPTVGEAATGDTSGSRSRGRGGRGERPDVAAPIDAPASAAVEAAPQPPPRGPERPVRQAPPQERAQPNVPPGAAPKEGDGKPNKGKKDKKGDEEPVSPAPN